MRVRTQGWAGWGQRARRARALYPRVHHDRCMGIRTVTDVCRERIVIGFLHGRARSRYTQDPGESRDERPWDPYRAVRPPQSEAASVAPPLQRPRIVATERSAVTLATVMNMSGMRSRAMSRPIPSTGTPNCR